MKRTLAFAVVGCLTLAGCTGGGSKPAASSATSGAATTPAGTTTAAAGTSSSAVSVGPASSSPTGSVGPNASASPTSSGAPTAGASATASAAPPVSPPPPAVPVTAAQAAAVEQHFDTGENKGLVARDPRQLAGVESCSVLSSNAALATAERAIGYKPPGYAAAGTALVPAGFVEPASVTFPQQFLYVENYRRPSAHFTPYSLNLFTRSSAGAPWRLCSYPNLFDKAALPKFATIAKNVVPVASAAQVARAQHAASRLAGYLTLRARQKDAPPAGLVVPFGSCPTKYPDCNPSGVGDPYFAPISSVSTSYQVSTTSKPVYSYPLANGDTLAIAELHVVSRDTARTGYLQQPQQRSYWDILVPPGDFHSVTLTDALDVVLEVTPDGAARLIGEDQLALSAATTPR